MLKTLSSKFALTTLLLMLGSLLLGFFFTNTYYHQIIKAPNDAKNVEIAETMVAYIEQEHVKKLDDYFTMLGETGYQLYVIKDDGTKKFYGGAFRDKALETSTVESVMSGTTYHGMRDFPRETFVMGFFANELVNTIGVPFTYEDANYALFMRPNIKLLFSEVHRILGALMLAMFVLSLIGVIVLAQTIIKPIKKLTMATRDIAHENFDAPLEIERVDEIGQLANSFKRMTDQLQENDEMRKEFISNVSHDFQSPLLNIQGYATLLAQPNLTEEERAEYGEIIEIETKRLSKLTKQLLVLTTLDSSTRKPKREIFDLSAQLKDTVRKYRWQIEEHHIDFAYTIAPVMFKGDAGLLQNIWDNIIANAIKYSEDGAYIELTLEETVDDVVVTIQDTGIGMSEEAQARIFERFYRADESRTKHGTGLGLPIVKQVVEKHEGTIDLTSKLGQGTTVKIILPKL
ncbi:MAG TPA: HAMP domain-containing sensor histidine kinase [Metalysinibacillus sp.]